MSVIKHCQRTAPYGSSESTTVDKPILELTVWSDDEADCMVVISQWLQNNGYAFGDTYDQPNATHPLAVIREISPKRREGSANPWIWDVTIRYDLPTPNAEFEDVDGNPTDNPLLWRWEVEVQSVSDSIPVWAAWNIDAFPRPPAAGWEYTRAADTFGPVVNSAGTVLDPPLTKQIYDTVLRVSGNLATCDEENLRALCGSINFGKMQYSAIMTGSYNIVQRIFDEYVVKCTQAAATFRFANQVKYWNHRFEFRFKERQAIAAYNPPIHGQDGWLDSVLDRGIDRGQQPGAPDGQGGQVPGQSLHHPEGAADKGAIRDHDKKRVAEPVLLDGRGQPLKDPAWLGVGVWFRWRSDPTQVIESICPLDIFDDYVPPP